MAGKFTRERTIHFSDEELAVIEERAKKVGMSVHGFIKDSALKGYKYERRQDQQENILDALNFLSYAVNMIQETQVELANFLLVQLYSMQKAMGMEVTLKEDEKDEIAKAAHKMEFCKKRALNSMVEYSKGNRKDPLFVAEYDAKRAK